MFAAEFAWSYLADMAVVSLVHRKALRAALYDLGALVITYEVIRLWAIHDWDRVLIYSSVIGAVLGTYVVASRKIKSKIKKPKDEFPVNI